MNLNPKSHLIGNNNFSAFEINNLYYRANDIKLRQQIIFPYLNSNQSYKIDLVNQLSYPLLMTALAINIVDDDDQLNNDEIAGNPPTINLFIRTINRKTQKVIDETFYQFSSPYFKIEKEFILNPENLYQFKSDRDISGFTITGEPVYFFSSIIIKDEIDRTILQGGIEGGGIEPG